MRQDPTFHRWAALAVLGALATAGCFFADEPNGDDDEGDDESGGSGWTPGAARPGFGGDEAGGAGGASSGGTLSRGGASAGGSLTTGGTSAGGANPAGGAGPAGGSSAGGSPAGGASAGGNPPTGGTSAGGAPAGSGPGGSGGTTPRGGAGGSTTGGAGGSTTTGGTGGSTTGGTGGSPPTGAVMKFCNDLARGTESVTLTVSFSGVRATAASGTCTPIVPNACIPIPTGSDPSVVLLEGTTEVLSGTFVGFTVAPGDEVLVLATFDEEYMEPTVLADTFELIFGTSCASTDPFGVQAASRTRSAAFDAPAARNLASALRLTSSFDDRRARPAFRLHR